MALSLRFITDRLVTTGPALAVDQDVIARSTDGYLTALALLIQRSRAELLRGRTSLVIAHRLSTILAADRIVVLDEGRVVEVGPHGELLRRGGTYARMYRAQFRPDADDGALAVNG